MSTDAHVAEWLTLQPPAFSGKPTPEQQAEAAALGGRRKEFLKALAKELGTTEKKLEKELKKKMSKAAAKAKPKVPKAPKEDKSAPPPDVVKKELCNPVDNHGRGEYHVNSPELLAEHLKITGGKWQTRFPPEPNGYLHIGHAKAMGFNFGQATSHGGNCYLRFDDTNPTAEKQEYIDSILANVKWLGHTPYKVTFTSDYFGRLHELAVELIKRDKAFVCHQTDVEVKASRDALRLFHGDSKEPKPSDCDVPPSCSSPWRDRPVEESLKVFEQMRCGMWDEGSATLRMKMDVRSPNPNMWDHMAYRIQFFAHPRTGDAWCIYPTYDYSHCLVDSMENVTHSMCTLEFETRQSAGSSYHWLLSALEMYHSFTWEYSRCSISCNVMSKRRLNALVTNGHVSGWDDPRLLTLDGLKRRGYTPTAINAFCAKIGVARGGTVCVPKHLLESCIRDELDGSANRAFACVAPLKVTIVNHPGKDVVVQAPNHPGKGMEGRGKRPLAFGKTIFIDKADFRDEIDPNYFGLGPGKSVRLLFAFNITCVGVDKDAAGEVVGLRCEYDPDPKAAVPKGKIGWVGGKGTSTPVQMRLYDDLFTDCTIKGVELNAEAAAKEHGKEWVDMINPASLLVAGGALVEQSVLDALAAAHKSGSTEALTWQFTRLGYFAVDLASSASEGLPVFNKVCGLRQSVTAKKTGRK